jgi:mannosyltransferase OCH1-like enzyme
MEIPKIIHQIWSGLDGALPNHFSILGDTWKRDYPDWKYELWDNERIERFIRDFYPQYYELYHKFPYNIQRWDIIRYLILYQTGGMYVDFDYESLKPINEIITDRTCCFSSELEYKDAKTEKNTSVYYNNALMLSIPNHSYIKKIIACIFSEEKINYNPIPKNRCVLYTTGPMMLYELHGTLSKSEKEDIFLIPAKYVTPFSVEQAMKFKQGYRGEDLEDCLKEAYALHYFFGAWLKTEN